AGADPNAADDYGVTPLMRASENASPRVVQALLGAGADADAAQESGLTSLMIAARTGERDVVRALLAHGADVNAVTHETGVTALMWAVAGPHPDIVHVLLETGADVETSSAKGFTPLLFAARNGDIALAQALLAAGADVNGTGSDGTHPLPLAIVSRHAEMAHFLLEQGADPNGRIHGVTALHAAAGRVSTWLADWYRARGMSASSVSGGGRRGLDPGSRLPLVNELLARGADPNARITTTSVVLGYLARPRRGAFEQNSVGTGDVRGATPLWVAAFSANGGGLFGDDSRYHFESSPEILRTLLDAGADPNAVSDDGTTPLMMAAGLGYRSYQPHTPRGRPSPPVEAAVQVLVEAGADVNATNEADFTALHAATFRGLNEVIAYLVEQGADIDARDFRGRTAFRIAEGAKQSFQFQAFPETAEFLRELGANTRLGIPGDVHERADREVVEEVAQQSQTQGP
ncbi:MAG: ankyrin repeat domain-containing protein, partial [Acidobacteria bacterium]|nr:ankyrin repeat domain-containing protein [Acidobacteriota bacterium]